jgi:hypothetical protein
MADRIKIQLRSRESIQVNLQKSDDTPCVWPYIGKDGIFRVPQWPGEDFAQGSDDTAASTGPHLLQTAGSGGLAA